MTNGVRIAYLVAHLAAIVLGIAAGIGLVDWVGG